MARRKDSPVDGLLALVAMLPWWAGVGLAIVSYVFFHRLSIPGPPIPYRPGQEDKLIFRSVVTGLSVGAQYLFPILCLFGAASSAMRRGQRHTLVADVNQAKNVNVLDGMSWREFEVLVGEAFRLQGYQVAETGGGGPDGGVDLVLAKGAEKFLVQCKQWKAYRVGVGVVRELYGVMAARGAAGGFLVTSGRFTQDAENFASGRNVTLIDGQGLFEMIQHAQHSRQSRGTATANSGRQASNAHVAAPGNACPNCSSSMTKRTAKKGGRAGEQFWGCTRYPSCKGTRPMSST